MRRGTYRDYVTDEQRRQPGSSEPGPDEHGERRAYARRSPRLNRIITANIESGYESFPMSMFLVDISRSGMRINTDRELGPGTSFTLSVSLEKLGLALPGELNVRCRAVWNKSLVGGTYVHGLEFLLDGDSESLDTIDELLKTCTAETGRRRFRLNRLLPISVKLSPECGWQALYATDLSTGGLGTRLTERLPRGHEIHVRLHLEFDLPTVELKARVAWTGQEQGDKVDTGVEFMEVEDGVAETLQVYIDRCLNL